MLQRNFDFIALLAVLCGMAAIQQLTRVPQQIERALIRSEMNVPPAPKILTHWRLRCE